MEHLKKKYKLNYYFIIIMIDPQLFARAKLHLHQSKSNLKSIVKRLKALQWYVLQAVAHDDIAYMSYQ